MHHSYGNMQEDLGYRRLICVKISHRTIEIIAWSDPRKYSHRFILNISGQASQVIDRRNKIISAQ